MNFNIVDNWNFVSRYCNKVCFHIRLSRISRPNMLRNAYMTNYVKYFVEKGDISLCVKIKKNFIRKNFYCLETSYNENKMLINFLNKIKLRSNTSLLY